MSFQIKALTELNVILLAVLLWTLTIHFGADPDPKNLASSYLTVKTILEPSKRRFYQYLGLSDSEEI